MSPLQNIYFTSIIKDACYPGNRTGKAKGMFRADFDIWKAVTSKALCLSMGLTAFCAASGIPEICSWNYSLFMYFNFCCARRPRSADFNRLKPFIHSRWNISIECACKGKELSKVIFYKRWDFIRHVFYEKLDSWKKFANLKFETRYCLKYLNKINKT